MTAVDSRLIGIFGEPYNFFRAMKKLKESRKKLEKY